MKDPPQGLLPPPQGNQNLSSCPDDNSHRLRQFIAKPSAGLRIRVHPTLQSEQIGVLPVDGIVAIVDELQNPDGVWVRLSAETMLENASTVLVPKLLVAPTKMAAPLCWP